ncbi:hypothetical protein GCM10027184_53550 [Saccharothrix stipae]
MGAEIFSTYAEGVDVAAAFRAAVEQAQYDDGHDGSTGAIAEKDHYVVIDGGPLSLSEAEALADRLIEGRDSRVDDKWGPAGAIAVLGGSRTLTGLPVPVRADGYPDTETAALAAVEGRLGDTETVTETALSFYTARRRGIDVDEHTTATVTTTGSPEVTGWLFFGWANS